MTEKPGYHHGDLRAALVESALAMLETGEAFSLRAVARHAGVSTAAPYRHFADREALESALAVHGFRELLSDLAAISPSPQTTADVADFAVAYVRFALRRPALFRLMFGQPCDENDLERVRASDDLHADLADVLASVYPQVDAPALATAGWSLAHGLAFLHLDGKFRAASGVEVDDRVRTSFAVAFPTVSAPTVSAPAAPETSDPNFPAAPEATTLAVNPRIESK